MVKNSASPVLLVVLGLDLPAMKLELLPALAELEQAGMLAEHLQILVISDESADDTELEKETSASFSTSTKTVVKKLLARMKNVIIDLNEDESLGRLREVIEGQIVDGISFKTIYYLPQTGEELERLLRKLANLKLHKANSIQKVPKFMIAESACLDPVSGKGILKTLNRYYKQKQLFFLSQQIHPEHLTMIRKIRQANPLLQAAWSSSTIKSIDLVLSKKIFENPTLNYSGIVANEISEGLLPLLCELTVRQPASAKNDKWAKARSAMLKSIKHYRLFSARKILRAQYRGSTKHLLRKNVETFAQMPVVIDQTAWRKTRIRLIAGYGLPVEDCRAIITFSDFASKTEVKNSLILRLTPETQLALNLSTGSEQGQVQFSHLDSPKVSVLAAKLDQALRGDQTTTPSTEELKLKAKLINPLVKKFARSKKVVKIYKPGTGILEIFSS